MRQSARVAMLGPLGPAQLACLRSWRRAGVRTLLLHTEDRTLPRFARRIADEYRHIGPVPHHACEARDKAFQQVRAALDGTGTTALACLDEPTSIGLQQAGACFAGVRILTNTAQTLERLESKQHQTELARSCGFEVLPTWYLNGAQALPDAADMSFPLALRPDRATRGVGFKATVVDDAAALRHILSGVPPGNAIVAQPFIAGPNMVIHGTRHADGGYGPFAAYLASVKHQGVTVLLRPMPLDDALRACCERFVKASDATGVFHFDLVVDAASGKAWFLELNGRLGGTTGKAYAAGYDEPLALLQSFDVLPADPTKLMRHSRPAVSRTAALKCLWQGLAGTGSRIDYPFPQRLALLRTLLPACTLYADEVMAWRDPIGTLAFFSQYFVP